MQLWTPEHIRTLLPAMAVMLALCVILRKALLKRDLQTRLIPIKIIAVLLLLLELGKQVLSLHNGYNLYHLPLHFCSLFIFAVPALAFYQGRNEQKVRGVVAGLCGALFLLMTIYPNLIYPDYDIRDFFTRYFAMHTVLFHNLVMLTFMLIIALEIHTPQKGELKVVLLTTTVFCIAAASMAQILKTNYANFYSCNIPVLEQVRLSLQPVLGKGLTQLVYVLINAALHHVFVPLSYGFYLLAQKLVLNKKELPV